MKKPIVLISSILGILLLAQPAQSQIQRGETYINLGAGYSLFGQVSSAVNSTGTASTSTPVISGTVDFGLVKGFSYGIGISYQGFTLTENGYSNYTPTTFNIYVTNAAVRALYHFGSKDLEGYTGIRLGYSFWRDNGYNFQNVPTTDPYNQNLPTLQVLVGVSAFVSSAIGVHIELGLGTPYVAETGITFKFGGNTPAAPPPPPTTPGKQF